MLYQTQRLILLPLLACLIVSACTFLGITKPLTFDEKLASAYTIHTTVVNATTQALQAGIITSTEADKVSAMANTSRSTLDAARAVEATNATTASNDLALASTVLTAIQSFLNTSQSTAPAKAAAAKKGN